MLYSPIDVRCPACGKLAKFEEPFEFFSKNEVQPAETRPMHRWGGWLVLERFPSHFPWQAPSCSSQYLSLGYDKSGYALRSNGLLLCSFFHVQQMQQKHTLKWPGDAYWQWEIRGKLLWAWDRNHAEAILAYVKKTTRSSRYYAPLIKRLPTHFLTAKVRHLVVKKITAQIALAEPHLPKQTALADANDQ